MSSIVRATAADSKLLAGIGRETFIESHGGSAAKHDIDAYINEKYSEAFLRDELADKKNIYYLIYYKKQPAGYSKIVMDCPHPIIPQQNVTKLERLYLLKTFYELKLGQELMGFNIALARAYKQAGMWLFVWKQNSRAVNFYSKAGFKIIGSYDFQVSATHSNPNHHMLLEF